MKISRVLLPSVLCAFGLVLGLLPADLLAADGPTVWRPTYDLIMRWVNFVILVFVLVKFGKDPLLNMLGQRKKDLQKEISLAEKHKNEAEDRVQEVRKQLDASSERFEKIKERIIQQGANQKKDIIERAKTESRILIVEAKRRMDNQIVSARKAFQSEMVEKTMKIVFENLPRHLSETDDQKAIEQYLAQLSASSG